MRGSSGGASKSDDGPGQSVAAGPGVKAGPTLRLADFTARLHGVETDRYARLSIEIEVPTEKDRDDLAAYMPQIRDGFISLLADCTLDDFTGSAAVAKTKEKLTQRLHEVVPNQKIIALYITDLVVQ